jgi:ADP-heptose:LPS heptosyltransferase
MVDGQTPYRNSPFSIRRYWGKASPLAVINYSKSDRIKLAAWMGGVPVRAGIADGSFNWCYQFSESYEKSLFSHRVFRYLSLTQWLAGPEVSLRFETLRPERYGGTSVMGLLKGIGWAGGPYVVFGIYPHQQNPERKWLPGDDPWIRLAQMALRDGVTPVLVGGPEHRADIERIASASGSLCLAGKTNLPQLLALLANATGTIAVDTGIAHLAAATGKPTVVIFGHGREHLDLPCGPKVIALRGNPVGHSFYPIAPIPMEPDTSPWWVATHCIAAERAWGVLNYLANEPPNPQSEFASLGAGVGAAAEVSSW